MKPLLGFLSAAAGGAALYRYATAREAGEAVLDDTVSYSWNVSRADAGGNPSMVLGRYWRYEIWPTGSTSAPTARGGFLSHGSAKQAALAHIMSMADVEGCETAIYLGWRISVTRHAAGYNWSAQRAEGARQMADYSVDYPSCAAAISAAKDKI